MSHVVAAPPPVLVLEVNGRGGSLVDVLTVLSTAEAAGVYVDLGWIYGEVSRRFGAIARVVRRRLEVGGRVRRVAVVSGAYPRRGAVRAESLRARGLSVRAYPPAGREGAMAWAAGEDHGAAA